MFPQSGYAIFRAGEWFLRIDASALGYLSMAPHGHPDALHISVSYRGKPVIIDPGTGAYYADKAIRSYLAGWSAHNSPQLREHPEEFPRRHGIFLWGGSHAGPTLRLANQETLIAEIALP